MAKEKQADAAGAAGAAPDAAGKGPAKKKKTFKKRGEKRVVHSGLAHIQASFNNTVITITDIEGHVIAWSSAGGSGSRDRARARRSRRLRRRWPPATSRRRTGCARSRSR